MQKLFSSPYLMDCDQLRMALSSSDIEAELRNEFGQSIGLGLIGGVASFIWPEVWVRDEDYEKAVGILNSRKATNDSSIEAKAMPWKCPKCGESIEGAMTVCWNCETEKPIQAD